MQIEGYIERITYYSEETGFLVMRIQEKDKKDLTAAVGRAVSVNVGETVRLTGKWVKDKKYGEQFQFDDITITVPSTAKGIEKYLSSSGIKGIGPVLAGKIVEKFGSNTLEVIDNDPDRLKEVRDIGKARVEKIKKAWEAHRSVRELIMFLQHYGVSAVHCARIHEKYGDEAVRMIRENPYRLARDIKGIGFQTADQIACKMNFPKNSPVRVKEGTVYVLMERVDEGHVYYPLKKLTAEASDMLEVQPDLVKKAVYSLDQQDGRLAVEGEKVYPKWLHITETRLAEKLRELNGPPPIKKDPDLLKKAEDNIGVKLTEKQKEAVNSVMEEKILILTGGPGTGKTTIVKAMLEVFNTCGLDAFLAAPTGRAAKKMEESAGQEAKTIHRMLEYDPKRGVFTRNEDNPLEADAVIIDEASMMDLSLTYSLIKALPPSTILVIVGDVDQLPPVGPGNMLRDVIDSGVVKTVELNEIFRQSRQSRIVTNAHLINLGRMPDLKNGGDFYFIEEESPEKVVVKIRRVVSERIPASFGLDPVNDVQVISPMHGGSTGVANLNEVLQTALNPCGRNAVRGSRVYREGDRVIQTSNNYDKMVFNGDVGIIKRVDEAEKELEVSFGGNAAVYDFTELDEISLGYAISVHKSQGSEYPAVVMPVTTQHYILLRRNLLYTAVMRGSKLVVLVGTKKALAIAVKNNDARQRYSDFKERLRSA